MIRFIAFSVNRPVPYSSISHRFRDCHFLSRAAEIVEWSEEDDATRRVPRRHCKICEKHHKWQTAITK